MKPGASVRPAASTTSSPAAGPDPPTSTMTSRAIRTFALRPGDAVPSRTVALMITVAPVADAVSSSDDSGEAVTRDRPGRPVRLTARPAETNLKAGVRHSGAGSPRGR